MSINTRRDLPGEVGTNRQVARNARLKAGKGKRKISRRRRGK